jgi:predicted GNAT superfamily acetyltransferase
MCADIREWTPAHNYDVWHDRAVLHFLVDEDDRLRYARLVTEALNKTGILIVAAFAEDGPEMCSGLPVRRATQDDLVALFGDGFSVADRFREMHRTPWGSEQPFNWIVLCRH